MRASFGRLGLGVLCLVLVAAAARAEIQRVTGSIVNGLPTGGHPAVGALLYPGQPGSARLLCSGTMVGCRTFLTAGHCVAGFLNPDDYVVYLQNAGLFSVASVSLHPDHDFPEADVAVLVLSEPMTRVRPVPIDAVGGQAAGTAGTIVGFGTIGGSGGGPGIKRVGAVSIDSCQAGISNATSVCWAFESPLGPPGEDSNTCSGDSGGPLLVSSAPGDVVAGVTSGGAANDCLTPDLSFDARVSAYAAWIAGEGGADLASTSCDAGPQVGDPGTTAQTFDGAVSPSSPEGRHAVVVPAGAAELRVTMNGVDDGSDFDLYVKRGAPPTTSDFDCEQTGSGQFAACTFPAPAADTWHVLVRRFSGSGAYQATVTILGAECEPADEGQPCDDADACTTGETCQSGTCTGGVPLACDDGVACTADVCHPAVGCQHLPDHDVCAPCETCDPGSGCVSGPRPACHRTVEPLGARLKIRDQPGGSRDLLLWKLSRGDATSLDDLGDPESADGFRVCVYDESGPSSVRVLRADVPAGGTCSGKPCWRAVGTRGFKYASREATPDGVARLVLGAGEAGRGKVILKAKGENLPPLPPPPLGLPLRVQLHGDAGACWESTFGSAGTARNGAGIFVGRGD